MYIITAIIIIILFFTLVYSYKNRFFSNQDFKSVSNQYIFEMKGVIDSYYYDSNNISLMVTDFHNKFKDLMRLKQVSLKSFIIVQRGDSLLLFNYLDDIISYSYGISHAEISSNGFDEIPLSEFYFYNDTGKLYYLDEQKFILSIPNPGKGFLKYRIPFFSNQTNSFKAVVLLENDHQKSIFLEE